MLWITTAKKEPRQQPKQWPKEQPKLWILLRTYGEHILCIYLQYADKGQCIHRATLPIGVNDGGKEEKQR